jgi:hypothetical protein
VNCDKCKCKIKYKIQNTVLYSRLRDCTVRHDVSYTVLYSSTTGYRNTGYCSSEKNLLDPV